MTVNHSLNLTNLSPGKIYYAQAFSSDSTGTSISSPLYFSTASNPGSSGAIEVYFNFPVDHSVALLNNNAVGGIDLKTRLLQRIDSADHSIDIAMYSFNEINQIRDRLIIAITRGVKIRMVYDHREGQTQQLVQDLINAGVKVQRRPIPTGNSYIMHNKIFIFDARDTTSYSDDWLWTGSANITNNQFYSDAQNVIFIQDQALCNTYTREFEEMWGSHTDINNPSNAKFGSEKTDNTPHLFNINGKKVRCYFSPSENVSVVLEDAIDTETDKSISFCIYAFTRYQIANEMKGEYNPPTKMVRGVFDHGNLNGNVYLEMKGIGGQFPWNPPAEVYLENFNGLLHHKYMLIDADDIQSNPIVEMGSYNYSNAGTFGNDENVLLIYDSLIANQYYQEFVKRFTDAGGSIGIQQISTEVPSEYMLSQNYPNPFNPTTVINFDIPKNGAVALKVFDITGREISTLVNKELFAGSYKVTFDGSKYGSGVYFYQLQSGGIIETKKMILVK
jgi:phosphatidylserine/phosphatidylglycerophosphate/cardiolipin synthase-like enzyme